MRDLKDYIEDRAIELATYIINNNATVRDAAKRYSVSKSTVHTEGVILKDFTWKWRKSQKYSSFQQNRKITTISTTT